MRRQSLFFSNGFLLALTCAFMQTPPLFGKEHSPKIILYKETSFDFDGTYRLSSPSFPDLLVKVIVSRDHYINANNQRIWVPEYKKIELHFTLDSSEKTVTIVHKNHGEVKISGLNAIQTSYWHPAIKQLAQDLSTEFYGTKKPKKKIHLCAKGDKKRDIICIQPLEECEFHTICAVERRFPRKKENSQIKNITITIREKSSFGKGKLLAEARFWQNAFQGRDTTYSIVKFDVTKQKYHPISFTHFNRSSPWYQAIKKVTKLKVERYLQYKHKLNDVRKECSLPS